MKLKNALLSMLLALFAGYSGISSAHTDTNVVGPAAGAVNWYHTTCFSWNNGAHPAAPVGEVNGAATKFFTSVVTNSGPAANVTQVGGVFGNGVHYFKVGHAAAGTTNYTVTLHCQNAANAHTGTGDVFSGNPGAAVPTVDFCFGAGAC